MSVNELFIYIMLYYFFFFTYILLYFTLPTKKERKEKGWELQSTKYLQCKTISIFCYLTLHLLHRKEISGITQFFGFSILEKNIMFWNTFFKIL